MLTSWRRSPVPGSGPGSGRPALLAPIGWSWCRLSLGLICPHQFDQAAHRNVRSARHLTFRWAGLWSSESTTLSSEQERWEDMTEIFMMPFTNGRIADVGVDIFPQKKQPGMSQS